mmetsp:Transcript_41787/g.81685  ORF Transcript_41787/g.81685 Transcript_41787/m.81685 type:complete len:528 (+) Transcript_41787:88-1671(+)
MDGRHRVAHADGATPDLGTSASAFKKHHALNRIKCGRQASSNPKDIPVTVLALLHALVSPLGRLHLVPDTPTAEEVLNGKCEPNQLGWRIQHSKLYNHIRPFFSTRSSHSTIRWEINKVLKELFLVPATSAKATSLLGEGVLLIPRTAQFQVPCGTLSQATHSSGPGPWENGACETRYRGHLENGCQKAALSRLTNVELIRRVLNAMWDEGYWRGKDELVIKMELQQAHLYYKDKKAQFVSKMINTYARHLRQELSMLTATDVSLGEASTAGSMVTCNEFENTADVQDTPSVDASMVDFEESCEGEGWGPEPCQDDEGGTFNEIESQQSRTVTITVDKLCSSTFAGNPISLLPTMQVQISTLSTIPGQGLCTLRFRGSELYTVFKPSSPVLFARHTFYKNHTTKRVSVALSPDLQLPKSMAGSEFLVQIVAGPLEGGLRVLWVDGLRCKSMCLSGKDATTRTKILKELYDEHSLLLQSPSSHVTSSVIPIAFSAAQLQDEAGLHVDGILFFSNTPGTMAIACRASCS